MMSFSLAHRVQINATKCRGDQNVAAMSEGEGGDAGNMVYNFGKRRTARASAQHAASEEQSGILSQNVSHPVTTSKSVKFAGARTNHRGTSLAHMYI